MAKYHEHSQFADLLKNSEGRLTSMLSLFRETLIFIFDSSGRFTFGHADLEARLHSSPADFIGHKPSEILPVSVSEPFEKAFNKNKKREIAEFMYQMELLDHTAYFSATCSPIFRDGVFDGSLAIVRDVTQEINSSQALKRSEENYRTLVEMASIAIVIIQDGKVVFSNPVTSEISGFCRDRITGHRFLDFLVPDEQKRVSDIHILRTKGGNAPFLYETKMLRSNGSDIAVEVSARTVEYQGKTATQILIQDISARKQAEEELVSIHDTLQTKVAERTAELEQYKEHLEDVVSKRTERLRSTIQLLRNEIGERILAEERVERLNLILKAIRDINLLITRETEPVIIINETCRNLVRTREYNSAWIILTDGSNITASESEHGENLEPLKEQFLNSVLTPCIEKSLNSDKPWVSHAEKIPCSCCPVVPDHTLPRYIMGCRIESHGKVFGTLTVTVPGNVPPDHQEIDLFKEVSDDIAFALYSIEHKKARDTATKTLVETEDRYEALFENSGMAILFLEEDMILDCNSKAAEIFQCSRSDLLGLKPYQLSPVNQPDGKNSIEKSMLRIDAAIKTGPQFFRWVHTRINGGDFPAEVSINSFKIGNRNYIQAIINDITTKEEAENALRTSEKNYRTLSNNVPVGLFRSNPEEGGILLSANPMMAVMFGYEGISELLGNSISMLFVNSDSKQQFLESMKNSNTLENYETPMRKKDGSHFWASISAKYFQPGNRDDVNLIDGIVNDISEKKLYEDNLQKSLSNLRETIEGTVSAMSLLVEMKDPYTSGHQKGVALLACAIGREMGLDENTIDCIRIASTLHDLGKLNVPLEILNKPGSLNEFEMDFIRTHPKAGYDILKAVEFPWPVAEVIHQHHERQDGSGYPRGLKGKEIMIEAAIISVADVVEAIASRRPYRASMGVGAALETIKNGSGIHFNETVVDCCLKLFLEKGFKLIDHDIRSIRTDFSF